MNPQIASVTSKLNARDYSTLLRLRNCKYKEVDQYYLQVGTIKKTQGWIIHVSSITAQVGRLLQIVLPDLIRDRVPFKIIRDERYAHLLLEARLGYLQVGKIITIYPEDDNAADSISKRLIQLTQDFKGPAIPTDAHLGGTVYTRYGSFNPVIVPDEHGAPEKHIYDAQGKLMKDPYAIPFIVPKGIAWPFANTPAPAINSIHVLNNTYLVTSELKGDVKGRVFKAIRLKGWSIKHAVVKEGKHDQSTDQYGRDIMERLRWQYDVQKLLSNEVSVPKVYDFFQEDGNCYFGMEYVKGEALLKFLIKAFEGVVWQKLPQGKRLTLLDHLLQILTTIRKMHELGYLHRDISPVNFIVHKNKIIMIDLEGSYSLAHNLPNPPYLVGTPGFTAPEQDGAEVPTIQGDIYSLGALMFTFFTGLSPGKFVTDHTEKTYDSLGAFNLPVTLRDLIIQCLDADRNKRPSLGDIIARVEGYRTTMSSAASPITESIVQQVSSHEIRTLATQGLSTYNHVKFAETDRLWHTNYAETDKLIINRQVTKETNPTLYSGVSGGLYLLAQAKAAGFHTQKLGAAYTMNYKFAQQAMQSKSDQIPSGLLYGKSGIALAVAKGIESRLLADTAGIRDAIRQCLDNPVEDLTIASGSAGQCLAILHCKAYLKAAETAQLLDKRIDNILQKQRKDGSWPLADGILFTGLERGVAGIALSLLHCYERNPTPDIKQSVLRAFEWLDRQTIRRDGVNLWRASKQENAIDPWLGNGIAGIALCYLYANKIFKDSRLRAVAEIPLDYLTDHLTQNNLSLANGLAGIGEVYLETNIVTQTDKYQDHANKVTAMLRRSCYEKGNISYWIVDDEKEPDGSLMNGNGGIIHYLMRYQNSEIMPFPILGLKTAN